MSFEVLSERESLTFYVNNKKPTVGIPTFFSADGDELELVRQQFENIPITKGNYCSWTDEMAYFIFRNLILP